MSASYPSNSKPEFTEVSGFLPEDWDLLFVAVLARLRDSVEQHSVVEPARSSVLDCIQALDQLRLAGRR